MFGGVEKIPISNTFNRMGLTGGNPHIQEIWMASQIPRVILGPRRAISREMDPPGAPREMAAWESPWEFGWPPGGFPEKPPKIPRMPRPNSPGNSHGGFLLGIPRGFAGGGSPRVRFRESPFPGGILRRVPEIPLGNARDSTGNPPRW